MQKGIPKRNEKKNGIYTQSKEDEESLQNIGKWENNWRKDRGRKRKSERARESKKNTNSNNTQQTLLTTEFITVCFRVNWIAWNEFVYSNISTTYDYANTQSDDGNVSRNHTKILTKLNTHTQIPSKWRRKYLTNISCGCNNNNSSKNNANNIKSSSNDADGGCQENTHPTIF